MIKRVWQSFSEACNNIFMHRYYLWFVVGVNVLAAVINFIDGNNAVGVMFLLVAALFAVINIQKIIIERLTDDLNDMIKLNSEMVDLNKELFAYIDRLENERAK